MWSKVSSYIKRHKLLDANSLYLVALSGGADSVALLLLLHGAGYKTHAAHCNFHLRGEESNRDEEFCVALCSRLGIPLHLAHFDTAIYAEKCKVSIEMAARELRYRWFEELRHDIGAEGICVAHHRDDSVETVLMNLLRGTGLRGLTGIQPRNGHILRPLLCVSRSEIEAYLAQSNQDYVTDSTNLVPDVMRNKLRLQVLPMLASLNPAVAENIQRTTENLQEAMKVLDALLERYKNLTKLNLSELEPLGSSEYIAYEWAKNYGFNGSQVAQLLAAETGTVVSSAAGFDLLADRGRLLVEPSLKPQKTIRIPETGTYVIDDRLKLTFRQLPVDKDFQPSKAADCVTLDAAKVAFPLTVRRVETGDRMNPFGMKGSKLISDLMTDKKLTVFEKRRQLGVVDAQGIIIWLVGLRTDERCRIDDNTKETLTIEAKYC